MTKGGLNTHVFGQSVYNWIALPAAVGEMIELPIMPVKDLKEALVFISATFDFSVTEDHYYACFTRSMAGGHIPFHYLFLVGGMASSKGGCNSANLWLPIPEAGVPRVVYVQKMSGSALAAGEGLRSGATVLALR